MRVSRKYTAYTVLALMLLLCLRLTAQPLQHLYQQQNYPEGRIYSIYQDRQGYIWLASENGAIRYDGTNYKIYGAEQGIPNVDIWDFTIDSQNRIWCHTKSKRPFYIYQDSVYIIQQGSHILDRTLYQDFKLVENEIIHRRLHLPLLRDFSEFSPLEKLFDSLYASGKIGLLGLLPSRQIAIGLEHMSNQIRFSIYSMQGDQLSIKPLFWTKSINSLNSWTLYDRYLVIGMREGNRVVDLWEQRELQDIYPFQKFDKFYGREKFTYYQDSLLINSHHGALYMLDSTLRVIDSILPPQALNTTVSLLDDEDNLWYLHPAGVSMLSAAQRYCQYHLRGKPVRNIVRIGDELLLAIELDGFYRLPTGASIARLWIAEPALASRPSTQIGSDQYLILNHDYLIKSDGHHVEKLSTPFPTNLKGLMSTPDGIVAIGTYIIGPLRLTKRMIEEDNQYYFYQSTAECGFFYKNKKILGTTDGLYDYKPAQKSVKILPDTFSHNVTYLTQYQDYLLVGTKSNGLYEYDGKHITSIPHTAGMTINDIDVLEDAVWLATDKGVIRLLPRDASLISCELADIFTQHDGLLTNYTHEILIEGDTLWAGSEKGLTQMPWKVNREIFNTKILFPDTLAHTEIKPKARKNAHIDFSVLNTTSDKNLKVEYRIKGYDTSWQSSQSNHLLLPELSPGKYELQIRASDYHGHEVLAQRVISVIPLWHERSWVRVLMMILAIALLAYIIYGIIDYIKTQKLKKLEQEKQLSEVRLFALRSQMNPHFINNSLNAIQYLVNSDQSLDADKYISKFSRLVRMFFRNSQKQSIPLQEEIEAIKYYLDLEKLRFDDKFEYHINTDGLQSFNHEIPSMLIQPIVENSIKHGIFHKKGKGHIDILLTDPDDSLNIQVIDDGVGLTASAALSKREKERINSTSVLKERIELLNKSRVWDVSFERKEIVENQNVKGTKVEINIKKQPEI